MILIAISYTIYEILGEEPVMRSKLKFGLLVASVCFAVLAYGQRHPEFVQDIQANINDDFVLVSAYNVLLPGHAKDDIHNSGKEKWMLRVLEWSKNVIFPRSDYVEKAQDTGKYIDENIENTETMEHIEESMWIIAKENEKEIEQESSVYEMGSESTEVIPTVATPSNGIIYPKESLYNYNFLMNTFYIVDSSTSADEQLIDGEQLINYDLSLNVTGEEPKILIYHTHSQEDYIDSRPGVEEDTVVGLGIELANILQNKYKISVIHDRGKYDVVDGVEDRNEAYYQALNSIEKTLEANPSIQVVIDLHRDGVKDGTHLVTEINGKKTAQIMFFNGLCRGANADASGYIQNPYLFENLAFSLQMQLKAAEKYPGLTRRIYLRNYRFNMHVRPRTLLVECGAQTNTVEEAKNAMEPLADLLYCVLSGE